MIPLNVIFDASLGDAHFGKVSLLCPSVNSDFTLIELIYGVHYKAPC